jgi:homogentisate 1,2-dioxygenase
MDLPSDIYQNLQYLKGFGNSFATEALPGAIPEGNLSVTQAKTVLSN